MKESDNPLNSDILESVILRFGEELEQTPMVIAQIAIWASKEFGKNPFQEIQKILDKHNLGIKLVAIPTNCDSNRKMVLRVPGVQLPTNIGEFDIKMPYNNEDHPFYLWVTSNRQDEYFDLLERLEVSENENFRRLTDTGMVTLKEGSEKSKILKAGLN